MTDMAGGKARMRPRKRTRAVSVRVEVHISGSLYSRIRFKPEAITEGYLTTIRKTVVEATEFALRVNREPIEGYRTLPVPTR